MRIQLLVILNIACLLSLISAGHIESGKAKADALRELMNKSPNGIIAFNSTGFRYFLTEQPRPYEVVIFFTAPKCEFCESMFSQYELAAKYYYEGNAYHAYRDKTKKLRAVFFGIMNFEQSTRDVFLDLDFKSVPNMLVSVPKHAMISDSEKLNFLKGFKWQISGSDGLVTFHKVLEYVNKRTGREIEYQAPLSQVLYGLAILLACIIGSIIIFRMFKPFFLNTKLWFIGSMVIYFFCMAGFIYNQIHDTPFTTVDSKGQFQWMTDNQRIQLGAEGFVMSGLFVLAALTIISWHFFARMTDKKFVGSLMFVALFGITLIIVLKIEELYRFKGWYTIQFFPPENYSKGPLMRDQGNSI